MIEPNKTHELEQSYLVVSQQLGEVLSKKMAAYEMQAGVARLHQRIIEVGQTMLTAADPRPHEQEYLSVTGELQELLRKKGTTYSLVSELSHLHGQLINFGRELGWTSGEQVQSYEPVVIAESLEATYENGPVPADRLSRLQQQIEDLRTALA